MVKVNVIIKGVVEITTEGYDNIEEAIFDQIEDDAVEDVLATMSVNNEELELLCAYPEEKEEGSKCYEPTSLHVPHNAIIICPQGILQKCFDDKFYECYVIKKIGDSIFENIGAKKEVNVIKSE